MSDLTDQLAEAKRRLSRAAESCLKNEPGAAEAADQANAEVDALLAIQKAQAGQLCGEPGCKRITLRDKCDVHRPADVWGEARRTLDELHREEGSRE